MATIQVRDLPEDVAETFRRRAKDAGQSLQAYMRQQLTDQARRRTKRELLDQLRTNAAREQGQVSTEDILAAIDDGRR